MDVQIPSSLPCYQNATSQPNNVCPRFCLSEVTLQWESCKHKWKQVSDILKPWMFTLLNKECTKHITLLININSWHSGITSIERGPHRTWTMFKSLTNMEHTLKHTRTENHSHHALALVRAEDSIGSSATSSSSFSLAPCLSIRVNSA